MPPEKESSASIEALSGQSSAAIADVRSLGSLVSQSDDYWHRVLALCHQRNPVHFAVEFPSTAFHKFEYIDSGTYSHVMSAIDIENGNTPVVFKVIKVLQKTTQARLNDLSFKGCELYQDVFQEIVILNLLSNLHETVCDSAGYEYQAHSFPRVFRTRIVHGPIPNYFFLRRFDETVRKLKPMEHFEEAFGPPREYLVTVMKFGGDSLWDRIQARPKPPPAPTVDQLISVCFQVAFALAVAEGVYQFEHRDLHVCNVLIKPTKKAVATFKYRSVEYTAQTYGMKAVIIDATFSRMAIARETFYLDLGSRLRGAASNPNPDGQEVAYKKMYHLVKEQWKDWHPQSNIIWLQYFFEEVLTSDAFSAHAPTEKKELLKALIEMVAKEKKVADFMVKVVDPEKYAGEQSTVSKHSAQSMSDLKQ